jgi:magnesium chelatase subunit I
LRTNPEINNERGVSVRSTIHSLEIIIGEVEVTRSIINNAITIPRFSDIYCMFQSSKFELEDIEDTTENKVKFLNNTIIEIIREISKEYFAKFVNAEDLIAIKNEFRDKTFTVSQNQYHNHSHQSNPLEPNSRESGTNNSSLLYAEQLKQFPAAKKILKKAIEKIKEEQTEYIEKAQKYNIFTNLEYLVHNNGTIGEFDKQEEAMATVTELLLEYLRLSNPPVLERKENRFEYVKF